MWTKRDPQRRRLSPRQRERLEAQLVVTRRWDSCTNSSRDASPVPPVPDTPREEPPTYSLASIRAPTSVPQLPSSAGFDAVWPLRAPGPDFPSRRHISVAGDPQTSVALLVSVALAVRGRRACSYRSRAVRRWMGLRRGAVLGLRLGGAVVVLLRHGVGFVVVTSPIPLLMCGVRVAVMARRC